VGSKLRAKDKLGSVRVKYMAKDVRINCHLDEQIDEIKIPAVSRPGDSGN
jgi:hypothetical protein